MKNIFEFSISVNGSRYFGTQNGMDSFNDSVPFDFVYFEEKEIKEIPTGDNVFILNDKLVGIAE